MSRALPENWLRLAYGPTTAQVGRFTISIVGIQHQIGAMNYPMPFVAERGSAKQIGPGITLLQSHLVTFDPTLPPEKLKASLRGCLVNGVLNPTALQDFLASIPSLDPEGVLRQLL